VSLPACSLLLVSMLLVGGTAAAQPQPSARQRQDRRVLLPGNPDDPTPEIRVAGGNLTILLFNAPLDRDSLEVDRARFNLVDAGERSLTLLPTTDLGSEERLVLKVRFKDRLPTQAVFALVSHPSEVDGTVEVAHRPDTLESSKATCMDTGPAGFVFSGVLDKDGIQATPFFTSVPAENRSGLQVTRGVGYRAQLWAAVSLEVRNLPGQKPWVPGTVRLTGVDGALVTVRAVHMKPSVLKPRESGLLVLETAAIANKDALGPFLVELLDEDGGRALTVSGVKFK